MGSVVGVLLIGSFMKVQHSNGVQESLNVPVPEVSWKFGTPRALLPKGLPKRDWLLDEDRRREIIDHREMSLPGPARMCSSPRTTYAGRRCSACPPAAPLIAELCLASHIPSPFLPNADGTPNKSPEAQLLLTFHIKKPEYYERIVSEACLKFLLMSPNETWVVSAEAMAGISRRVRCCSLACFGAEKRCIGRQLPPHSDD